MSIALECLGLQKRFAVGAGRCGASAQVLRGVDLTVPAGECLAVVGVRGAGKSTLLLCAAGLLRPEGGEVRWFGHPFPPASPRAVAYYWTPTDFARTNTADGVGIHLVDFAFAADWPPRFAEWIERRRDRGETIVLATRDEATGRALAARVVFLRRGQLMPFARGDGVARVAEPFA